MSDFRTKWQYINKDGDESGIVPVHIQDLVWAAGAGPLATRDPDGRTDSQPRSNGWDGETPFGDEHNFIYKLNQLFLAELESRGFLYWSATTDYTVPAVVWGSNQVAYKALLDSGPGYGGAKDPAVSGNETYWEPVFAEARAKITEGVVLSNESGDEDYGVVFGIGKMTATNGAFLNHSTPIIKKFNLAWAAGSGNGGNFNGSTFYPDYTIHCFLIQNDTTKEIDAGFDDNVTAPNIPVGYTAYRRVGSLITQKTSVTVEHFSSHEFSGGAVKFNLHTPINAIDASVPASTRVPLALQVPHDIYPDACFYAQLYEDDSSTPEAAIFTSQFQPDLVPDIYTNFSLAVGTPPVINAAPFNLIANDFGEIYYRVTATGTTAVGLSINTWGWTDRRID